MGEESSVSPSKDVKKTETVLVIREGKSGVRLLQISFFMQTLALNSSKNSLSKAWEGVSPGSTFPLNYHCTCSPYCIT